MIYHPLNKIKLLKDDENSVVYDFSALKKQHINIPLYNKDLKLYIPNKLINTTSKMDINYEYLLFEFLESSWISYYIFVDQCLKHNITHVIDIGCALGIQSLLFNQNNISYHGIDIAFPFFNYYINTSYQSSYSIEKYPLDKSYTQELLYNHNKDKTAIISSLCMYWIINKEQEEQLYYMKPFRKAILHISKDNNISLFKKYYSKLDIIYESAFCYIIYLER